MKQYKYIHIFYIMNILLNEPLNYHDWNCENNDYDKRITNNKNIEDFWNTYYSTNNKYQESDIQIYDDIIPGEILQKINSFSFNGLWKYNHVISTNKKQIYKYEDVSYDEIKKFKIELYGNLYFHTLFTDIILPKININNKENIIVDRVFISGRMHGLSDFYHKDDRSSSNYAASVYIFLNNSWKSYFDGSISFILDNKNLTNTKHVENKYGRIIVFQPHINHKCCEISGYGLLENAFSQILEYHLIYDE